MAAIVLASGLAAGSSAEANCQKEQAVVAVDVGHSPKRGGAISARGKPEYEFNYRFAKEFIQAYGQSGDMLPIMINPAGQRVGLKKRTTYAARINADMLVSFHHDSVHEKFHQRWVYKGKRRLRSFHARGYSLFVSRENPKFDQSLALARSIGRALKASGFQHTMHHTEDVERERRETLDWEVGVFNAPFAVLRQSDRPAILIELGVIINPDEEALLNRKAYRAQLAAAIAQGIRNFCAPG